MVREPGVRELGLDDALDTVYRALLHAPQCGRAELASRVGCSEAQVAERLAALCGVGLVRAEPAAPSGAVALDVTVALEAVLNRAEDEAARQQRRIVDLRVAMAAARRARTDPDPGSDSGVEEVHGVARVRERIAELSFFTRTGIRVVQPARAPSAESVAAARPLDRRSTRRNLDVRVVHDAALTADAAALEHLRVLDAAGTRVRVAPGPLQRLMLFDDAVAVVPLDPGDTARGAAVVTHPGTVAALAALFELTWSGAAALPGSDTPTGPDDADATVLALLAQGCTDEVTARRTGMSGRNVRRRVARLMDELDAGSRFAAGAAAVRRGWI